MKKNEQIRSYIIEASLCDKVTDETLIFEQGLLDSMGLLFLVQFIKEEFNVITNDSELTQKNFESINSIVSFIDGKIKAKEALPIEHLSS